MSIEEKFLDTIQEYKMLSGGDKVLVAASGGADSTALLHLFDAHKDKLGISLHIVHLNHNIRRGEAELDVRYVQALAQKLKLPITVESFDVPAYANERKIGIEEAARQVRYAFFERVAQQVGANKIAVGHSADDNVETFLMRLLRGAGLKGLCGIPAKRGKIVRPLIRIWRREIEDYVGMLKLVPRRDHTNYESKYMRNRVRLKLIPQLKLYNLNIKEIILQTVLLLTGDSDYLETKAEEALSEALLSEKENEIRLAVDKIKKFEYPIQGHLIREAIERVKGNLTELSFGHVQEILEKLNETERWELHLPSGIIVSGGRKELMVGKGSSMVYVKKNYRYVCPVPGEIDIREIGKKLRISILDKVGIENNSQSALIDYAYLGKNVVVRSRTEGDRFIPLGMKGSKKLQDFFVDEKVPLELRDFIPIIESGGKMIWVGGLRIDDRVKIGKSTKKAAKLELL